MRSLRAAYFIAANTALLVCVILLGTHVGIVAYDAVVPRLMRPPMSDAVRRNYAHLSAQDLDDLMQASSQLRFRYQPVVGYVNAPMSSRLVNVDDHGIRANSLPARGIDAIHDAVWFFGGSTAFGDGVADHESIPARLERLVHRPVINLAVRNHGSAEETLLLNHYLRIGYRPSLALFLDGINEYCVDYYSEQMQVLFDRAQVGYRWDIAGPLSHAAMRLARKISGPRAGEAHDDLLTCTNNGRTNPLPVIHERRLAERDAVCRLYRIECRTLVQPFPGLHGRHDELDALFRRTEGRYLREVFARLASNWQRAEAVFVTDALDRIDHHAFIDEIHYSAEANGVIATMIADRLGLTTTARP